MTFSSLCIFGTRPEAIKMAPVIKKLESIHIIKNKICITGQHQDLLNPILDFFRISPDFN